MALLVGLETQPVREQTDESFLSRAVAALVQGGLAIDRLDELLERREKLGLAEIIEPGAISREFEQCRDGYVGHRFAGAAVAAR